MMEDPPEAEENILYGDDFSGGGSSSEYQQAASHLPLDQDRLIPSAQSTGQGETTIGDSDRGGRAEVCQPPRMSRVSDDGGGDTAREKEMTARLDVGPVIYNASLQGVCPDMQINAVHITCS